LALPAGFALQGAQGKNDEVPPMQTVKFVYWQEGEHWLGYFRDSPDYWTQAESLDDLKDHLADLYQDLTGGELPGIRKVGELNVS
jgi:hypothetical protein